MSHKSSTKEVVRCKSVVSNKSIYLSCGERSADIQRVVYIHSLRHSSRRRRRRIVRESEGEKNVKEDVSRSGEKKEKKAN